MTIYKIFPTHDIKSGVTFAATRREATRVARAYARHGRLCTVSRQTTGRLTRALLVDCLNEEGFVSREKDLEIFEPVSASADRDTGPPYRVVSTRLRPRR